jgi:hypothetical protein
MKKLKHTAKPGLISRFFLACALGSTVTVAQAQTYTAIDLSPATRYSSAYTISGGIAAGYVSATAFSGAVRAALWDGFNGVNLHPSFLDDVASGIQGRSSVQGNAGNLQVGWGAGPSTNNRSVPLTWIGSAESATTLTVPFAGTNAQASATDGTQIVGYGTPLNRDGTTTGPFRAVLWDVASGAAVDLGDGGGGAQALGVGGGQQVGYVVKSLQNAALWKGSANTLVVLHPKNAVVSVAFGTDGVSQVGYSGYDVRVRVEAFKGLKDKRFNYATVWNGSAASALNIHPAGYGNSFATAVKGSWIAGYASDETRFGTPGYYHAIVWDSSYQSTDLQSYLPAQFVGSQALSVDESGNVSGVALTADGQRHAIVWKFAE